jgi:hypothetical protein
VIVDEDRLWECLIRNDNALNRPAPPRFISGSFVLQPLHLRRLTVANHPWPQSNQRRRLKVTDHDKSLAQCPGCCCKDFHIFWDQLCKAFARANEVRSAIVLISALLFREEMVLPVKGRDARFEPVSRLHIRVHEIKVAQADVIERFAKLRTAVRTRTLCARRATPERRADGCRITA